MYPTWDIHQGRVTLLQRGSDVEIYELPTQNYESSA